MLTVKAMKTPGVYRVTLKTATGWTPPAADGTTATTNVTIHVLDECFTGPATKVQ